MPSKPGGGYGWSINEIGAAISRYAAVRNQNQKPWGITKTASAIGKYFFSATSRQLATILRLGEQAFQAGKQLSKVVSGLNISRQSIPVDTSLPKGTAYRTKVLVKLIDGVTGAESYKTMTMDWDSNPNLRDITLRVTLANVPLQLQYPRRDDKGNLVTDVNQKIEFDKVLSVVRRTY